MANQIEKLNTIAVASIEKLNGLTDANMEKVNGLEFTGTVAIVFAAGGTLSTARTRCSGFGRARNASLVTSGRSTSSTDLTSTEIYGGTSFSGGNPTTSARATAGGCGSSTDGLVFGGNTSGVQKTVEEYDGSFTNGGTASSVGGDGSYCAGTGADALMVGGYIDRYRDDVERYTAATNNFATKADSPANLNYGGMMGSTVDGAIYVGGHNGSNLTSTYKYDASGNSWSTEDTLTNARFVYASTGTATDCVITGGTRFSNNDAEEFNGTNWSATSNAPGAALDLYSPSDNVHSGGTTAGVSFGGGTGSAESTGTNQSLHVNR